MPATVQRLLDNATLHLTLLAAPSELPAGALDAVVAWVHSSDLPDPTPFLSDGVVLLTTGTQFGAAGSEATTAQYEAYVSRLREHSVAALGFGTDVVREGTPDALVDACRTRGLPLFEVPYRTPFIAIARLAADITAEDAYARNNWALAAQRAMSSPVSRPRWRHRTPAHSFARSRRCGRWSSAPSRWRHCARTDSPRRSPNCPNS